MNKNKKRIASGLILAGTSLASIAGQAATNVSAEGGIFGSIKNFFTKSKNKGEGTKDEDSLKLVEDSLKLQKKKIIDLEKKGKLVKSASIRSPKPNIPVHNRDISKVFFEGIATSTVASIAALFTSTLMSGGLLVLTIAAAACYWNYVMEHNSYLKEAEEARANLNGRIKEDMLNKQYTLKKFEDIVRKDEDCSEFIRQLLVLERAPDDAKEGNYKPLDNGELEEAKKVLKKLFLDVNSVGEIKDLKKLSSQKKEKLLKVIKPLFDWTVGEMPKLFGEGDYFYRQNDKELLSKVCLLKNVLDDYRIVYSNEIEANDFIDFICCNKDVKEKAYTKEYKKHSFIHFTREFLKKSGVDVKLIDDDLLLDSAKILFGDLQMENIEKLDKEENEDSKKPLLNSVIEKYYSKFKDYKNPAEMSIAVLGAIKTWIKETVISDNVSLYNRDNQQESFQDRINAVRSQLKNVKI